MACQILSSDFVRVMQKSAYTDPMAHAAYEYFLPSVLDSFANTLGNEARFFRQKHRIKNDVSAFFLKSS